MDVELDALHGLVDCRSVLDHAGWVCDFAESSAGAVKYRNGGARIVIVAHQGKGWFDPLAGARGDVLALAQYMWGGSLGHARMSLWPLAGIAPVAPVVTRTVAASTATLDA